MGTSRGYDAPTEGSWPSLKREVTRLAAPGGNTPRARWRTLAHFAAASLGGQGGSGSSGTSGGGGGGGGGGSARLARTGARVGARLGAFADLVGRRGLAEALRSFGLEDLIDRPAAEVLDGLIDALVGPPETRDDALALQALEDMRRALFAGARTADDIEALLHAAMGRAEISGLIREYYGYYLYEAFVSDFYERLLRRSGEAATRQTLDSVQRTITEALAYHLGGSSPTDIDWSGPEGRRLCDQILGEVRDIFVEGEEKEGGA